MTLSHEQASWAQNEIERQGLAGKAEVRHLDYRDVTEAGFDAVSSIGLTEHIGVTNYPAYFRFLRSKLRTGGRLLNHCITRPDTIQSPRVRGGFIDRYVFPDGELTGVGRIVSEMQNAGIEVRHEENLREHYAKTCAAWCDNLVANWEECVAEVGEATARVWGLYLAGSQARLRAGPDRAAPGARREAGGRRNVRNAPAPDLGELTPGPRSPADRSSAQPAGPVCR